MIVTLTGTDVTSWGPILGYIFRSSINSGVIAMVGGLVLVPIVSLFTAKQDAKVVDEMFNWYDVKHEVSFKTSLND